MGLEELAMPEDDRTLPEKTPPPLPIGSPAESAEANTEEANTEEANTEEANTEEVEKSDPSSQPWENDQPPAVDSSHSAPEPGSGEEPLATAPVRPAREPVHSGGNKDLGAARLRQRPTNRRRLLWLTRARAWIGQGANYWKQFLSWVRARLPEAWRQRLSDQILTAGIVGLLTLLMAIATTGTSPSENISIAPTPEPKAIESAAGAETLAVSPKQGLIGDIQDQMTIIARTYASDLVQSVQANFQTGKLIVTVGPQWYSLETTQQDQLAQDLCDRTRELAFEQLLLQNGGGEVVARSPVIGHNAIVLAR